MLRLVTPQAVGATLIVLTAISAHSAPAGAQDIDRMVAETLLVMNGRCTKATVLGRDLTSGCEGELASNNLPLDRVQFHFTFSNGAVVTLTGRDRPNPTPDIDEIRIASLRLNLGIDGVPSSGGAATGRCRFGNPFARRAKVDCQGKMDGKSFSLQFTSDGRAPR